MDCKRHDRHLASEVGVEQALILETSSRQGQIALAKAGQIIASRRLEASSRRASDLALTVGQLLAQGGWRPTDLTAVLVGLGPGSFTGLRVGVASAKALAYALGCSFVGIDTFAAIALRLRELDSDARPIVVLADALQGNVFVRQYQWSHGHLAPLTSFAVQPLRECIAQWPTEAFITGPAVSLITNVGGRQTVVADEYREATPTTLWDAAQEAWAVTTDMWRAEPHYLRGSSAEEKRQQAMMNVASGPESGGEGGEHRRGS